MPPVKLSREEFEKRYRARFADPAFKPLQREIDAIVKAAWDAYSHSRKAPVTRKAGPGFADPDYEISVDWLAAREAILDAQRRHDDAGEEAAHPHGQRFLAQRTLLSGRNVEDLAGWSSSPSRYFPKWDLPSTFLDLSRLTSEFGKQIHPCKSCVSTSMPLCHWALQLLSQLFAGQTDDWMNEIYPLWVAAHGVMIAAPVKLVSRADRIEGHDGPAGLRRRRQP